MTWGQGEIQANVHSFHLGNHDRPKKHYLPGLASWISEFIRMRVAYRSTDHSVTAASLKSAPQHGNDLPPLHPWTSLQDLQAPQLVWITSPSPSKLYCLYNLDERFMNLLNFWDLWFPFWILFYFIIKCVLFVHIYMCVGIFRLTLGLLVCFLPLSSIESLNWTQNWQIYTL